VAMAGCWEATWRRRIGPLSGSLVVGVAMIWTQRARVSSGGGGPRGELEPWPPLLPALLLPHRRRIRGGERRSGLLPRRLLLPLRWCSSPLPRSRTDDPDGESTSARCSSLLPSAGAPLHYHRPRIDDPDGESTSAPPSSRSCTSGSGGGAARSDRGGGLRRPSSDWTSPTRGHGASKMAAVGGAGAGPCSTAMRSSERRREVVGGPAAAGRVVVPPPSIKPSIDARDLEVTGATAVSRPPPGSPFCFVCSLRRHRCFQSSSREPLLLCVLPPVTFYRPQCGWSTRGPLQQKHSIKLLFQLFASRTKYHEKKSERKKKRTRKPQQQSSFALCDFA
jgi:hypothetical protein